METYAFKIQIAPSLYQRLGLERTTYVHEQDAINVLTEGFNKRGIAHKIKEEENRTVFVNERGGELAVIVPC